MQLCCIQSALFWPLYYVLDSQPMLQMRPIIFRDLSRSMMISDVDDVETEPAIFHNVGIELRVAICL